MRVEEVFPVLVCFCPPELKTELMDLPCKSSYLCKDLEETFPWYIHIGVIYAGRKRSGQEHQYWKNKHIYMLSMYSCSAGVGVLYLLFLMKEELTVLSTKF